MAAAQEGIVKLKRKLEEKAKREAARKPYRRGRWPWLDDPFSDYDCEEISAVLGEPSYDIEQIECEPAQL